LGARSPLSIGTSLNLFTGGVHEMRNFLLVITVLALGLAPNLLGTAGDTVTLKMWTFLNPDGTSPRDLVLRAIVEDPLARDR